MNNTEQQFDLIVLGAGISGLGLADLASEKGLKVCLIEKGNLASETSDNSLRIIHGGFRYLQKFDFKRVIESAKDQSYCLNSFPDLIKPLDCILPLSGKGLKKPFLARLACLLYRFFLRLADNQVCQPLVLKSCVTELKSLYQDVNKQSFLKWQDALVQNPALLAERIKKRILQRNGQIFEQTEALEYLQDKSSVKLLAINRISGQQINLRSARLVTCLGPHLNFFTNQFSNKWSMAFNLILKRNLNQSIAFACEGDMGRSFFFVPRNGQTNYQTVLGTDYYQIQNVENAEAPSEERILDFINAANRAMPALNLRLDDVDRVEWGIIPVKSFKMKNCPEFYGSSLISRQGSVVHILSTKYTGFRSQALKVLKLLES